MQKIIFKLSGNNYNESNCQNLSLILDNFLILSIRIQIFCMYDSFFCVSLCGKWTKPSIYFLINMKKVNIFHNTQALFHII